MEIISENELTQRNRFSATEKEYIDALIYVLNKHGIPESRYSLFGYGEACICLRKKGDDWEVYEGEREIKTNSVTDTSIINACIEIISRVVENKKRNEVIYDFGCKVTAKSMKVNYGTGRNKGSVARVHLFQGGTGAITINGRDIDDYFGLETLKLIVRQPLETVDLLGKVDIEATVVGGGFSGQAGAIRHGVARALLQVDTNYRSALKSAGFLTSDPRMLERKKYGLTANAAERCPLRIAVSEKYSKHQG